MKRTILYFAAAGLAAAAVGLAVAGAVESGLYPRVAGRRSTTPLAVEPAVIALGVVGPNESHQVTATVTNTGREPARLVHTSMACSCTQVEVDKQTLAPGEAATVSLSWRTGMEAGRGKPARYTAVPGR